MRVIKLGSTNLKSLSNMSLRLLGLFLKLAVQKNAIQPLKITHVKIVIRKPKQNNIMLQDKFVFLGCLWWL